MPPGQEIVARGSHLLRWTNVALLVTAILWIFFDPRLAPYLADREFQIIRNVKSVEPTPLEPVDRTSGRGFALSFFAGCVISSLAALSVSLFRGRREHRGLRSWLGLTTLIALWLGLAVSWRDLSWAGTRMRLAPEIESLTPLAAALRDDWPAQDDTIPGLGQFSAYPPGKPRVLMVIATDPEASHSPVAAVERSLQGALRFQLAGDDPGTWLEWHPDGSKPASFTGGLEDPHELERFSQLSPEWFAVRYSPPYTSIEQSPADVLTPAK